MPFYLLSLRTSERSLPLPPQKKAAAIQLMDQLLREKLLQVALGSREDAPIHMKKDHFVFIDQYFDA